MSSQSLSRDITQPESHIQHGLRHPFMFSVDKADVNDEYLDEIIELQQSQVQQQLFKTTTLSTFWCHQIVAYPLLAKKALR